MWLRAWLCVLAVVARADVLETESHFLSSGVLEATQIRAQPVGGAGTTMAREGIVHSPRDPGLAALLADAASACGRAACLRRRFSAASPYTEPLEARVQALATERFGGGVACAGARPAGRGLRHRGHTWVPWRTTRLPYRARRFTASFERCVFWFVKNPCATPATRTLRYVNVTPSLA